MEQLIILALVVVFYVGKNLLKKAMGGDKEEDAAPPPIPTHQTTQAPVRGGTGERKMGEQEEKMRKFFEALGLPTDSLPPAPVAPKPPPPRATPPPIIAKKPKVERRPPPLEPVRPSYMPDAPMSVTIQVGSLAGPQAQSPAEMYASTHISAPALRPVSQQDLSPAASIAQELRRSPLTLRRAMIVNELLGKPLAMR
jgi:hypothetical protein